METCWTILYEFRKRLELFPVGGLRMTMLLSHSRSPWLDPACLRGNQMEFIQKMTHISRGHLHLVLLSKTQRTFSRFRLYLELAGHLFSHVFKSGSFKASCCKSAYAAGESVYPFSYPCLSAFQIVVWSGAFIASSFTVTRIAIRSYKFRKIFSDDILVIIALAVLLASAVLYQITLVPMYTLLRVAAGLEPPKADFMQMGSKYLKLQFAITCLFWTILWTVKLSFLAFFRRLSSGLKQHETAWWIVLVFVVLSYVSCYCRSSSKLLTYM